MIRSIGIYIAIVKISNSSLDGMPCPVYSIIYFTVIPSIKMVSIKVKVPAFFKENDSIHLEVNVWKFDMSLLFGIHRVYWLYGLDSIPLPFTLVIWSKSLYRGLYLA